MCPNLKLMHFPTFGLTQGFDLFESNVFILRLGSESFIFFLTEIPSPDHFPEILSAVCTCERVTACLVFKICIVPVGLGVFTPFPVPMCIGAITVVTFVRFTQMADPGHRGI